MAKKINTPNDEPAKGARTLAPSKAIASMRDEITAAGLTLSDAQLETLINLIKKCLGK